MSYTDIQKTIAETLKLAAEEQKHQLIGPLALAGAFLARWLAARR